MNALLMILNFAVLQWAGVRLVMFRQRLALSESHRDTYALLTGIWPLTRWDCY